MNSVVGKNNLASFMKSDEPQPATPPQEESKSVAPEPSVSEPVPTPAPAEPTPEPVATPTPTPAPQEEPKPSEPSPKVQPTNTPEPLSQEAVKSFLKEKYGKEVEDLDTLFKAPEPQPQEDPYDGLSESAKQFLKFNKETGRDYNDYQALNRDVESLSALDIAREKAIKQSNGALSSADVDEYLEKKLNIDLSDTKNLEKFDQIELNSFGSDYKNQLLENKNKYATPIEKPVADTDLVTLDDGTQMPKASYESALAKRNQYLQEIQKASDKITASSYDIKIDDNGTEKVMSLAYEYTKKDVLDMAANASDLDNTFTKIFSDANGGIDHKEVQEGLFYADKTNRERAITAIVHKALAEQAQQFMADEHNVKVDPKQVPTLSNTSKRVPLPGQAQSSNTGFLQHFISQ